MKRLVSRTSILALATLAVTLLIAGCSDNNAGPTDPAPAGFVLKENGAERVKQAGSTVTGNIEIIRKAGTGSATSPSGDLDLSFTNADATAWTTEAQDSVEISGFDDQIVTIQRDPANKWRFRILAKGAGETKLNFVYFRGTKLLFQSRSVPITIVAEGLDIAKMRLLVPPSTVITISDTVTGKITAAYGTEPALINIDFFDAHGDVIDVLSDPNVTLSWDVADTSVLDFYQDQFDSTIYTMLAKKAGNTTVSFKLTHDSPTIGKYTAFTTPDIVAEIH
jgi:hypothetical protein